MKYLKILFLTMTWALALVLTITFFTAYFDPTKSTLVYINRSGEADLEAVLLQVIIAGGLWALVDYIRSIV